MRNSLFVDDYRMESRPIPDIGDDEILVKVLAVGICAGDAKCFSGAPYFWGKAFSFLKFNNAFKK